MSRDGSGSYSLPEAAFVSGTTISSTTMNSQLSDLATAMTASLAKDGQTTPTANLPMGSNKLTGLSNGSARTDSAALGQVQDSLVNWVAAGGTADAITAAYSPAYAALTDGMVCFVRFANDNATTTPTFAPSSLTARPIVKWGGDALAAGDIQANAEGVMRYNLANTRWELLNPRDNATVTTTRGDLIVRGASADGRLAVGAANRVLKSDGTDPAWGQVTGPMIAMGSDAQGDILYHNGTSYVRLGAGTAGQALVTGGAGANPSWASAGASVTTIDSGSLPAAAIKSFTSIPATYRSLRLVITGASSNTATRHIRVQVSTNNGSSYDTTAANYRGTTNNGTGVASQDEATLCDAMIDLTAAQTADIDIVIDGYQGGPHARYTAVAKDSSGTSDIATTVGFYIGSTSAINAIQILWNGSGNFDAGTYALYGIT